MKRATAIVGAIVACVWAGLGLVACAGDPWACGLGGGLLVLAVALILFGLDRLVGGPYTPEGT